MHSIAPTLQPRQFSSSRPPRTVNASDDAQRLRLDRQWHEELSEFAKRERCDLKTLIIACYAAHVHRLGARTEFVSDVSSNSEPLFAVDGEQSFRSLLQAVRHAPPEIVGALCPSHGGELKFQLRDDVGYALQLCGAATEVELVFSSVTAAVTALARRSREFETLLRDATSRPEVRLCDLQLLSAEDRRQLLETWNDTETRFALMPHAAATVLDLFDAQVKERSDETCVAFEDRSVSYADVDAQSKKIAACLREKGVKPGNRVVVCAYHDAMLPSALLGVMRAGAAYVPIDPDYPRDRVRQIIEDAEPSALVGHERCIARLDLGETLPRSKQLLLDVDADEIERGSATAGDWHRLAKDDIAYIIYTSGSTGRPKGVLVPHGALANLLCAAQERMEHAPGDRCLMISSISFDISIWDMFVPLIAGATCVLGRRDDALSGRAMVRLLEEKDITVFNATPAMWRMLLDAKWEGKPDLRAATGGEAVSSELVEALLSRVRRLWNAYGPTECTVLTTLHRFTSADPPVPIGAPLPNTRCYVLDANMQLVPVGVPGELWIGGAGVTAGYLGQPELTHKRFVQDPFAPSPGSDAKMYRSGDRVRWLEPGVLQCLDRIDNQVKVRGYRIELGEIETVLQGVEGVVQVVVRAVKRGEQGNALVAYVRPEKASDLLDPRALRKACVEHVRERLPNYMIPAEFVFVEEFKLGPTGKIDRNALPSAVASLVTATADTRVDSHDGVDRVAPRTPVEEALLVVFEEVLGAKLSVFDDFFAHGGNSLAAVQIVDRLARRGLSVQPTDILRHPTVASLAEQTVLSSEARANSPALVPLDTRGDGKPLFLLHSMPGDLLGYGELVQELGGTRPIHGFQGLSAFEHISAQDWSIESLAEHYIDVLQTFQPHGPYHFAGWCFGGLMAMEMAHQLERSGKQVGLLALMEAWPYRTATAEARRGARLALERKARLLPDLAKKLRSRLTKTEQPDPLKTFALDAQSGPFRHRREVYQRSMEAAKRYYSPRYGGKALLIKSSQADSLQERDYGWHEYLGGVDVVAVDASHENVLRNPAVQQVASAIEQAAARFE